ncbi:MAG: hypothetical protein MI810_12905 [Flavobacteriales bacterium]|nr:hypothetical protein [Flavobacteriales bacterium]
MKKTHILIASIAFLMCLISVFFGISIYNANENHLIQHLNEMDQIHYFDKDQIPVLNHQAVVFMFPLVLGITFFQLKVLIKAKIKRRKNIAMGLLIPVAILWVFEAMVFFNPANWDFSKWGFVWISMGFFLIVGNAVSIFIGMGKSSQAQN